MWSFFDYSNGENSELQNILIEHEEHTSYLVSPLPSLLNYVIYFWKLKPQINLSKMLKCWKNLYEITQFDKEFIEIFHLILEHLKFK